MQTAEIAVNAIRQSMWLMGSFFNRLKTITLFFPVWSAFSAKTCKKSNFHNLLFLNISPNVHSNYVICSAD